MPKVGWPPSQRQHLNFPAIDGLSSSPLIHPNSHAYKSEAGYCCLLSELHFLNFPWRPLTAEFRPINPICAHLALHSRSAASRRRLLHR
ncbi:hypothetical protein ZWY2020_058314 [Hordeum vulgare]|nr:hypothetical protein ZWY2020_058314 [Hordeum vulgare]